MLQTSLVIIIDGEPMVDSYIVANGLGIQHDSLMTSINNHKAFIESNFGHLRFEIGTVKNSVGATNQTKSALLNEGQALFIGTLTRNTDESKEFKATLVKAFIQARNIIKDSFENKSEEEQTLMVLTRLHQKVLQQKEEINELRPKAEYVDKVLNATNTWTTTSIAAELNMSAVRLNLLLKEKGIQYKQDGHWILKHDYKDHGYVSYQTHDYTNHNGETITTKQMEWTEKGRGFIHKILNPLVKAA